jgi:hypothetical protein
MLQNGGRCSILRDCVTGEFDFRRKPVGKFEEDD